MLPQGAVVALAKEPQTVRKTRTALRHFPKCFRAMTVEYGCSVRRACELQRAPRAIGQPRRASEEIRAKCIADSLQFSARSGAGQNLFDARARKLDHIDTSCRG